MFHQHAATTNADVAIFRAFQICLANRKVSVATDCFQIFVTFYHPVITLLLQWFALVHLVGEPGCVLFVLRKKKHKKHEVLLVALELSSKAGD